MYVFSMLVVGVTVFAGGGAAIAYGVAKPRYEERVARNKALVEKVYGTPCYLNEGVVVGQQLQRVAAILVQGVRSDGVVTTTTTLPVVFQDADLVFVDTPPVGLCGVPQLFWVLDGDASSEQEQAVTRKLTRPSHYCGEGVMYGVFAFAGFALCVWICTCACVINGYCSEEDPWRCCLCWCRSFSRWRLKREIAQLEAAVRRSSRASTSVLPV